MSNPSRLVPAGPGCSSARSYRVTRVLILVLVLLVAGWGQRGGSASQGWSSLPTLARAAGPGLAYPLYAWGLNSDGQLGNGTTTNSANPVAVNLPGGVTPNVIVSGHAHNLAIGSDGQLYAWGYNYNGELGNGTTTSSSTPVVVSLSAGVAPMAVAAGGGHSLAIGSDGKLYAWGYNYYGQFGNGTITSSLTPLAINLPASFSPTQIAAGSLHSLGIGSNGILYAWGYNDYGQLGNGTTINSSTPVTVSLPAGVTATAIAAGTRHSLAIGSNGKLYAWGLNSAGELGNGTTINSSTPVTVSLPAGVTPMAVTTRGYHSLAIGSDGKLYAWGNNGNGQLGNGTTTNSATPVVVSLPAGVTPTTIRAGLLHSLAIGSDGKLYAWGDNSDGQFGNGTTTGSLTPVAIGSVMGVANPLLAAGYYYSLGVLAIPSQIAPSNGNNQSATVGTAFATPLVASVRDVANNPVSSVIVTFTAPAGGVTGAFAGGSPVYTGTTDASGLVTATTFTANTLSGSYSVTAKASGVITPASFTLTNNVGAPANITAISGDGQSATVTTSFANPLVVSVTDQYHNPVSGALVTFVPPSTGPGAAFYQSVTTATTGANGQATSSALIANSVAGSYTVSATVSGVSTPANFTLTNTAGTPAIITTADGDGQSAAVTTFFTNSLVVSVTDQYYNPVSGTIVTFNPPPNGPSATFFQRTATSGANGQAASSTFFANSVAGSYTVSATVSGVVTPANFTLTNTPGPASVLVVVSGDNQQAVINTPFGSPLVAKVTDSYGNAVSGAVVNFAAPFNGANATFDGGTIYNGRTDATGTVTTTTPVANSSEGSYTVTASLSLPPRSSERAGLAGPRATSVQYHLINLAACDPLNVISTGDDGSCGTLRAALVAASTSQTKTVMINLPAGSTISLTSGLTLTSGVAITTTAPCGLGAGNTMLPPVTIQGTGTNSGNGLTLAGHNRLYGLWVRGFSGVQIKAPPGSSTQMQCVKASKL